MIVSHQRWSVDGDDVAMIPGDRPVDVYQENDPKWVKPEDLGPFQSWYSKLYKWVAKPSDRRGCVRLTDKTLVKNTLPLLDEHCPTLPIAWALKHRGWIPTCRRCNHDRADVGTFDSSHPTRHKAYYQVLLQLSACLARASHIPSRQPILFYKLLLSGHHVEPGHPHKHYMVLWKASDNAYRQVDDDVQPLALGDGDQPLPPLTDDDLIIPLGPDICRPRKRSRPINDNGDGALGDPIRLLLPCTALFHCRAAHHTNIRRRSCQLSRYRHAWCK